MFGQNYMVLGSDLGAGNMKLFGERGGVVYPSHVSQAIGSRYSDVTDSGGKRADLIEFDDDRYYTGLMAPYEGRSLSNNQAAEWILDGSAIKASLYGAATEYMHNHGLLKAPLRIQAGVPVAMLTDSNTTKTTAAINGWLLGEHRWKANGHDYSVTVEQVEVRSQAFGALLDYAINDGEIAIDPVKQHEIKGRIGVLSIGGRTIEMMVLDGGKTLVESLTSSEDYGVLKMLEIANGGSNVGLGQLDVRLRNGSMNGEYKPALKSWWQLVKGHITGKWGKEWNKFSKIILVGGGCVMLKQELLLHFAGKAIVANDPYLAIASGLYKRGVGVATRGK